MGKYPKIWKERMLTQLQTRLERGGCVGEVGDAAMNMLRKMDVDQMEMQSSDARWLRRIEGSLERLRECWWVDQTHDPQCKTHR